MIQAIMRSYVKDGVRDACFTILNNAHEPAWAKRS